MVFSSQLFLLAFLPLFLIAYFLAPEKIAIKNRVALLGSVVFFAWGEPVNVFVLAASVAIHYAIARKYIANEESSARLKKTALVGLIALDLCLLINFKYLGFVHDLILNGLDFSAVRSNNYNLTFLGISFITFHQISFLVDLYTRKNKLPRFWDYALYIFLFPQLIAGPIVRYHDIGEQFVFRVISLENFHNGMMFFSIGLAKKILLADPLGLVVDKIFSMPPPELSMLYAWLGILSYTFQIFFDFSGYSDMAIGLALIMGFKFPQNFNWPYLAKSITEFWQRWHITLSAWMREYLYIPLGGNRRGNIRTYLNLWTVFLLSGLWHGASLNFIAWGGYHGLFLSLEKMFAGRINVPAVLRHIYVMLVIVVSWVFFRSPSLDYAIQFLSVMFTGGSGLSYDSAPFGWIFSNRSLVTLILAILIGATPIGRNSTEIIRRIIARLHSHGVEPVHSSVMVARFMTTMLLMFMSISALASAGYTPFLYFRF